jgi:hypothetical protein
MKRTMILATLALSACSVSLEDERRYIATANPMEICIASTVPPTSYQPHRASVAKAEIMRRGIECDWAAVEMVKAQRAAADAASLSNLNSTLQLMNDTWGWKPYPSANTGFNNSLGGSNTSLFGTSISPSGAITRSGAGYLETYTTKGDTKTCWYRKGNVRTPIDIAVYQMCPQNN